MNISEEVKRLKNWSKGETPAPTKVDIFPTQKCNLNCKFCEFPNTDPKEFKLELNGEKLIEIINEAGEIGVDTFGIIGGEPFIKSGMIKIMEKIKENDINGSITTNATLLNKNKVEKIAKMKWDLLRISIDGIEETHDKLRGKKGTFSKLIENLDYFRQLKSSQPTIEINTVLNRQNYMEIPQIVQLADHFDIKRIFLLPVIEFNEEASKLKINKGEKEVINYLKKAEDLCSDLNIENNIKEVIKDELYSKSNETDTLIQEHTVPCFVPWYSISINSKGIATPCSQFEEKFGVDIREKNLKKVWNSKEFQELRRKIATKNMPKTCSKCCAPLLKENEEIRKNLNCQEKLSERYQ